MIYYITSPNFVGREREVINEKKQTVVVVFKDCRVGRAASERQFGFHR